LPQVAPLTGPHGPPSDSKMESPADAPGRFRLHLRVRLRGTSRQGLRPHLRRGRRRLHRPRSLCARRLRDAGDHQLHLHRRRGPHGPPEVRRPGPDAQERRGQREGDRGAGAQRGARHRLRAEGLPLEEGEGRRPPARPVRRHRGRRRRGRQQGRGRRRPGHHVRLCLQRDARADARADPVLAQHPQGARRCPPLGQGEAAAARRQEPGHAALRQGPAGGLHRRRRLDAAFREGRPGPPARVRRREGDRAPLCREGAEGRRHAGRRRAFLRPPSPHSSRATTRRSS